MAEDFRQIDGDGDLENKLSFVEGIVSTKLVIDPYIVKDFEVRLHGDVALLSGRTKMTGQYDASHSPATIAILMSTSAAKENGGS